MRRLQWNRPLIIDRQRTFRFIVRFHATPSIVQMPLKQINRIKLFSSASNKFARRDMLSNWLSHARVFEFNYAGFLNGMFRSKSRPTVVDNRFDDAGILNVSIVTHRLSQSGSSFEDGVKQNPHRPTFLL